MIGIVAGLILGYQFLDIMMQTMSEDNDMPTVVYLASYLYSIIGTWITSTGVNYMLSGKVKTICMVDAAQRCRVSLFVHKKRTLFLLKPCDKL